MPQPQSSGNSAKRRVDRGGGGEMVTEPRVASAGQDGLRAARVTEATQHGVSSRAAVWSALP